MSFNFDWDLFDYSDFVGSGMGDIPVDKEDKLYDPDGIVTPDNELDFEKE